jgi:hypothetical protein
LVAAAEWLSYCEQALQKVLHESQQPDPPHENPGRPHEGGDKECHMLLRESAQLKKANFKMQPAISQF